MRTRILDAARKLFLDHGFEKTSIRNIADAIEYSPATIYLYFKDKNDLFFALHQDAFANLMKEFRTVAGIEDPFARLVELGHQYIKWAIENPELYNLCFLLEAPMETLACREENWEEGMKSFDMLKMVIGQCITAGYFKPTEDIDTAALTVWSYIHGLVTIYLKKRLDFFEDDREMERIRLSYTLFVKMIQYGL